MAVQGSNGSPKENDNNGSVHTLEREATSSRSNSLDSCSVASEASAAIVSVFNSWSSIGSSHEHSNDDDDDTLTLDCRFSDLPVEIDSEHILDELRKRLPPADLPPRPRKKRRRGQPNCRFINLFGSRLPPLPVPPPPPPVDPLNELGFAEKDALFPLDVKIAHPSNDKEETAEDTQPQPTSDNTNAKMDQEEEDTSITAIIKRERPASPVTVMKGLKSGNDASPSTKIGARRASVSSAASAAQKQ